MPKQSQDIGKQFHSAYQAFRSLNKVALTQNEQELEKEFPQSRTLQVINFDQEIDTDLLKKWFTVLGKVRKIHQGSYINRGKSNKTIKHIYYNLIVFKNEYDMVKIFQDQYLQSKLEDLLKFGTRKLNEEGKDKYLNKLLEEYDPTKNYDDQKEQYLEEMLEDGFQLVKDFQGDVNIPNKQILPTQRPMSDRYLKKQAKKANPLKGDFYKHQIKATNLSNELGIIDESNLTEKELLKKKKKQVLEGFQKDKEALLKKRKLNEQVI